MDQFSEQYEDLIDDSYDCVDRIVLNAYFAMGQDPGACESGGARCTAPTRVWTPTI
jgi:hypothetical protein